MTAMTTSKQASSPAASGETPASPSRSLAALLCILPALYFTAIAAYGLINFSSYGADVPRFLRYIAAPGAIALALVAAGVYLPARKSANLGLASSAILFTLLLVEVFLNARLVMAMFSMVGMLSGSTADGSEAARGRDSIPPMYSTKRLSSELGAEQLDQAVLGGLPGKEVLLCSYDGKPLYYTADRYGFNNDDAVYAQPLDVMLVGDSFVEGHCQPNPDTFGGRLRALQPQTASIGMRSGGPLLELALIGRYGAAFEPDYVVMAFFEGNDWQNLAREAEMPWLKQGLNPDVDFGDPNLSEEQIRRSEAILSEWWQDDVSAGTVFSKSSFIRNIFALNEVWGLLGLDYPRVTRDQPVYEDVLARTKQVTEGWGGRLALVYIPMDARFRGLFDKSFVYDGLRSDVLNAASRQQIDVIDLTDVFEQSSDPTSLYAPDAHFSSEGAAVAAAAVDGWIDSLQNTEK
ncbi:hypothetical protein [Erythrobacter sp. MTPC3]|uniref:hypothetical protein n=1 Tax=Erythrobacter sp. MTPC3 TaxID=3056564 RepID=UPI0036F3E9E0